MRFFKKPTEEQILREQLAEAKRCRAIYRSEQERMQAFAQMYEARIERISKELEDMKGN